MEITIVVLNWNGEKYVNKCLTSIQKLQKDKFEIQVIVVDNASTDKSVGLIKNNYPEFRLIQNSQNLGYAEGNNVGIRQAIEHGSDFVWIVNPDVEVDPRALISLVNAAVSNEKAGIFGSKSYFAPGFEYHKDRYTKDQLGKVIWYAGGKIDWANLITRHIGIDEVDNGQYDQVGETDFVTGASMLLRVKMLNEIGLLDKKYFLYYEETDLCQRAKLNGWKLLYVPASIVWHANAQATGTGSPLVDYYTSRNRLLFGAKYAPIRTKLALARESIKLIFTGRTWQKRGIIDSFMGNWGQGSYKSK